jgi:hypothetical protein
VQVSSQFPIISITKPRHQFSLVAVVRDEAATRVPLTLADLLNGSAAGPQFAPLGGCWCDAICAGQSTSANFDPAWPNPANAG